MDLATNSIVSVKIPADFKGQAFSVLRKEAKPEGKIFQPVKTIFPEKDDLFEQRI